MSVLLVAWLAALPSARAGTDSEEARAYFDKATASFALGRYPAAAENFEKAFELKPDPALLYNAAQAHRLAGNKERALILYQNYLRLYSKAGKRAEVEGRVEELKKAIEHDRMVATSPPTTTIPSTAMPGSPAAVGEPTGAAPPPPPAPPANKPAESAAAPSAPGTPVASAGSAGPAVDLRPAPPPSSPPVMVTQSDAGESKSLTQKPLFWVVVGGAVAAAVVVVLVVALGGPKDPSPSLGVVK